MPRVLYALLCLAVFGTGAYVWKVKNTGLTPVELDAQEEPEEVALPPSAVVVEIGPEKLTQEDVDWEYQMATEALADKSDLTPIPDLGNRLDAELTSLRKTIIANFIERKLLYSFIRQDKDFNVEDPGRYEQCMAELQDSIQANAKLAKTPEGKARLKMRLCERSILDQYMKERLFKKVRVTEPEVVEYYKNHVGEFKKPERVEIRQVLLANEADAKRVRGMINIRNFADVAREKSIAPEAVDGGRLGPFSKATMPALFEMAYNMRRGEISDILKTPYGYHIITLLEKFPKAEQSLSDAHAQIEQILLKKKEEAEYQKWVERALASINVTTPKPLW